MQPPKFQVSFEELPEDPKKRHEILVDLFGQYLFWVREETLSRIRTLVESEEDRNKLGKLFRETYEETAALGSQEREIALRLVQSGISNFAGLFLTMISGQGFDDPLGSKHVFRYRLDMEICDAETGEVVYEETVNRGGEKFFPEYWGRWLNLYGKRHDHGGPTGSLDEQKGNRAES
jgi:hypothetical protein